MDKQPPANAQPFTQDESKVATSGAMVIDHKTRTIPGYVVSESELGEIANASRLVDLGIAIATASLGFGVGLLEDIAVSSEVSSDVRAMADIIYWLCATGFFVGATLVVSQILRRNKTIRRITGSAGFVQSTLLRVREWRKPKRGG